MLLRFEKSDSVRWFGRSFESFLSTAKKGRYKVEVKRDYPNRTIPQNSTYWLWLTCIEAETGTEKEDLHQIFAKKYLTKLVEFQRQVEEITESTTKLDTKQMANYMNKVQRFAGTELSIELPNPEDKKWDEFENYYSDRW